MASPQEVSERQMELLVEFAELNKDLALGRFSRGPLARQTAQKLWEDLALTLNSQAEGTTKTADLWRRYWTELKAQTKTKAADCRRHALVTGGGSDKLVPLNALEKRIAALIGKVAIEGLPGVRIPFPIEDATPSSSRGPTSSHTSTSQPNLPSILQSQSIDPKEFLEIIDEDEKLDETLDLSSTPTADPVEPPVVPAQFEPAPLHTASEPADLEARERPLVRQRLRNRTRSGRTQNVSHVPRWVRDLEERRVAAEERRAQGLASIASSCTELVNILREINNNLRNIYR